VPVVHDFCATCTRVPDDAYQAARY
jgi:hypothetical protein